MTQSEFAKWLESILGDTPIEELVSPEVLKHMNRVQLQAEQAAWNFAKEDAREAFEITLRAIAKTMFAIGYDAGREQAQIDAWLSKGDDEPSDEGDDAPRGLLPSY